jgi:lipopolysaccharide/colanic/teichoic acid biosynthesis glycosyltransferase
MKRYTFINRIVDIFFALCALYVSIIPICIIGLLIKLISPEGKIFYRHKRLSKGGKYFSCLKFRTMVPNAEYILKKWLKTNKDVYAEYYANFKLKEDPRIIKIIGNFLRKNSLDELPQFFNVLIGDMAIVGPRPVIKEELQKYPDPQKFLTVKPGITGLWQTSRRHDMTYEERVALEMHYIEKKNVFLDIRVMFRTFYTIYKKFGSY